MTKKWIFLWLLNFNKIWQKTELPQLAMQSIWSRLIILPILLNNDLFSFETHIWNILIRLIEEDWYLRFWIFDDLLMNNYHSSELRVVKLWGLILSFGSTHTMRFDWFFSVLMLYLLLIDGVSSLTNWGKDQKRSFHIFCCLCLSFVFLNVMLLFLHLCTKLTDLIYF